MTRDEHRAKCIEAATEAILLKRYGLREIRHNGDIVKITREEATAGFDAQEAMSTKNNPGQFDCYAKAAPDEPMFVLLARDPLAPFLVRQWANNQFQDENQEKVNEALECAKAMERWRATNPPEKKT